MSELVRTIAGRLRAFIGDRRRAKRRGVRLPFSVRPIDQRFGSNGARRPRSIDGHTFDVSATGLGLIVPAVRVGEHYLAGGNRRLQIKLELPGGPVEVLAIPVRYESIEENEVPTGYLIGVQVEQMSEEDRDRYNEWLAGLLQQ
jgi:hypothetical protein